MAGETVVTLVGNLTGDPELRFSRKGDPVASFTVASTPRRFDSQQREWRDAEPLFMRCSVWGNYAEHVAESLTKGARVIVTGRLSQRSWENEAGTRWTMFSVDVDEVGPALRFAVARLERTTGSGAGRRGSTATTTDDDRDPWAEQSNDAPPPF